MASSLICSETQSRVSSVLNRDVKQFGKKYMFDCNEETCWNSDQGEFQWVSLEFPKPVTVSAMKVQFQGGFSAKTCKLEGCLKEGDLTVLGHFYPEDNNSLQKIVRTKLKRRFNCINILVKSLNPEIWSIFPIQEAIAVDKVKIIFEDSADFFGRIIVYSLDVLGEKTS